MAQGCLYNLKHTNANKQKAGSLNESESRAKVPLRSRVRTLGVSRATLLETSVRPVRTASGIGLDRR